MPEKCWLRNALLDWPSWLRWILCRKTWSSPSDTQEELSAFVVHPFILGGSSVLISQHLWAQRSHQIWADWRQRATRWEESSCGAAELAAWARVLTHTEARWGMMAQSKVLIYHIESPAPPNINTARWQAICCVCKREAEKYVKGGKNAEEEQNSLITSRPFRY